MPQLLAVLPAAMGGAAAGAGAGGLAAGGAAAGLGAGATGLGMGAAGTGALSMGAPAAAGAGSLGGSLASLGSAGLASGLTPAAGAAGAAGIQPLALASVPQASGGLLDSALSMGKSFLTQDDTKAGTVGKVAGAMGKGGGSQATPAAPSQANPNVGGKQSANPNDEFAAILARIFGQ